MTERKSRPRVLLAGVTTRPLAESAARAGYPVTAIDAFGDLDLRGIAEVILARPAQPGQPYGPEEAAAAGSGVNAELVAYTSNFENYPAAVARLVNGRRLLGNPPAILARVRDPFELQSVLRQHGFAAPECRSQAPRRGSGRTWLLKPRRSGGGHGVVVWSKGQPVPRTMYLQRRIDGFPGSISFAGDGRDAVVLGFSRQLIGDRRFGAYGFRYCGSLHGSADLPLFQRQQKLLDEASRIAALVTHEFGLRGLNGIDFIASRGVPHVIEVNPRYSASMELIERARRVSLFEAHVRACFGELPLAPTGSFPVHGKAIVFARQDCTIPNSRRWAEAGWVADIPQPGARIQQGRPICTVYAEALDKQSCIKLLTGRAAAIYRAVKSPGKQAA